MAEFITTKNTDGVEILVSHDWLRRWPEDYPDATAELKKLDAESGLLLVQPPRSGVGSGDAAWLAWADANGVEYADGAKREDIWASIDAPVLD